jgi:hypothetical protein
MISTITVRTMPYIDAMVSPNPYAPLIKDDDATIDMVLSWIECYGRWYGTGSRLDKGLLRFFGISGFSGVQGDRNVKCISHETVKSLILFKEYAGEMTFAEFLEHTGLEVLD